MYKAIIIYETRSGATGAIARTIEDILKKTGIEVTSKRILNAEEEGYDLVDALKDVDAVILGSPTYNHDLFSPVKDFLFEMDKADLKGKVGAAFGSYGWSGEAVRRITDTMKNAFKMDVIEPGLKLRESPIGNTLEECQNFSKTIADKIKSRD